MTDDNDDDNDDDDDDDDDGDESNSKEGQYRDEHCGRSRALSCVAVVMTNQSFVGESGNTTSAPHPRSTLPRDTHRMPALVFSRTAHIHAWPGLAVPSTCNCPYALCIAPQRFSADAQSVFVMGDNKRM
jgi:hypothetical protein